MLQKIKKNFIKGDSYLPSIFLFALVVFFWTLFDTSLMYVTPILMAENAFSMAAIGVIIGMSSVIGALFDLVICKFFKNTDFRRAFLVMFVICAFYPLVLSQAHTLWMYLFAMGMWGIYFDLYSFGTFNFIGHFTKKSDHASSFGIVQIFRAMGAMLAPFIAGLIIARNIDWQIFATSWIFLGIAVLFFGILALVMFVRNGKTVVVSHERKRHRSFTTELRLWRRLGKIMTPVLCVTFFLALVESFFWTLGPLYVVSAQFGKFGGLLITAYILPALFAGWIVGTLTNRFGKKRIALLGILIGSTILVTFVHVTDPIVAVIAVFCAACFLSIAFPSINAVYADYISEAPRVDNEIESLEDLSFNSGYIFGPIAAGLLGQWLGIPGAFSVLGLIGVVLAAVLLVITPQNITIRIPKKEL